MTQLDAQTREFKKTYAKDRRELEYELGKTMRYRSIRELASGDSGNVDQAIDASLFMQSQ